MGKHRKREIVCSGEDGCGRVFLGTGGNRLRLCPECTVRRRVKKQRAAYVARRDGLRPPAPRPAPIEERPGPASVPGTEFGPGHGFASLGERYGSNAGGRGQQKAG